MHEQPLPEIVQRLSQEHPQVWEAYNALGQALGSAGPLDGKVQRLVKMALAVGGRLEGAVRSHTRRAMDEGITAEELRHTALLAVTTVGWPSAVAAISWIDDEIACQREPKT